MHLKPRFVVPKVMRPRSGYQAKLSRRAPILPLLILRLHRQLMAPNPARQPFNPPQRPLRHRGLFRRLLTHPLEKPRVRRVFGGDFERDEEATLGDGSGVDGTATEELGAYTKGLRQEDREGVSGAWERREREGRVPSSRNRRKSRDCKDEGELHESETARGE